MKTTLPSHCPSCGGSLAVRRLHCPSCDTEVEGLYPLPALVSLSRDDQEFTLEFVRSSGSLKEMARIMGVSYPTVRNRLDEIIRKLSDSDREGQGAEA
jgi:hypothetical protein